MKGAARTRKADLIILALLEQGTIERAATAVGVSPVTVWRWLQKPELQEAYRSARREAFSRSVARLQHASSAAVSTLLKVMVDKDAPAASRVRAADCVLDQALSAFERDDLEVRLRRLEEFEKNKTSIPFGLQSRVRALEQGVPDRSRPPKALVPGWLMPVLEKQGILFNPLRRVEPDGVPANAAEPNSA